mmetsp:Transcript_37648/g.69570  ORF Transcript_37648/g.69570 Transcript_37648/m.69570 type:complete len:238 (-) Transcript_37648:208-921(-)
MELGSAQSVSRVVTKRLPPTFRWMMSFMLILGGTTACLRQRSFVGRWCCGSLFCFVGWSYHMIRPYTKGCMDGFLNVLQAEYCSSRPVELHLSRTVQKIPYDILRTLSISLAPLFSTPSPMFSNLSRHVDASDKLKGVTEGGIAAPPPVLPYTSRQGKLTSRSAINFDDDNQNDAPVCRWSAGGTGRATMPFLSSSYVRSMQSPAKAVVVVWQRRWGKDLFSRDCAHEEMARSTPST